LKLKRLWLAKEYHKLPSVKKIKTRAQWRVKACID